MLLKWTNKNVLTVYTPKSATNLRDLEATQLIPGVNKVEKGVWDRISKTPGVKRQLSSGALLVMPEPAKDNKKGDQGLLKYSTDEAKGIIGQTYDTLLLAEWQEEDGRAAVIAACDKQLKFIEKSTAPKKKESDEDED